MKLMAGRNYKNDLSDIIGILQEQKSRSNPISFLQIDKAICNLYENWNEISITTKNFIENAINLQNYENLYEKYKTEEFQAKNILNDFIEIYPDIINKTNIDDILTKLNNKKINDHDL